MPAPYYSQDGITIYHGDCREVLPLLVGLRDLVTITDPPYGRGAYATDRAIAPETFVALRERSTTLATFGYPEDLVGLCIALGVQPDEWVTWWPTNKAAGRAAARLPKEQESIAIFGPTPGAHTLSRPRAIDRICHAITQSRGLSLTDARMGDVWRDASPGMAFNYHQRLHPNEKPLSLMQRLIQLCGVEGRPILDPFCGSGTTLRAAKDLGYNAVGVEVDEQHCETAARRLSQMVLPLDVGA